MLRKPTKENRSEELKSFISLDITSCSKSTVNQRFGETCRHHLQVWWVRQARNQHEALYFLAWLSIQSWRWKWHTPPKCRLTSTTRHYIPDGNILPNHGCWDLKSYHSQQSWSQCSQHGHFCKKSTRGNYASCAFVCAEVPEETGFRRMR